MSSPSVYLEALIKEFSRLPGIGPKSASRLAFHILSMTDADVERLTDSVVSLKKNITTCRVCGGISDSEICSICKDTTRDRSIICVVEHPRDILTIEGTGEYNGIYHVLGGLISPLDGVGPEDLFIKSLIERCKQNDAGELVLALNPSLEGDATTLYLARLFNGAGIKVSRIARGLPVGADLEFADSATIIKSIEGRVEI